MRKTRAIPLDRAAAIGRTRVYDVSSVAVNPAKAMAVGIVRNGGSFGTLVRTFEARVDGPYACLNTGRYLSSNPEMGQGGVALTFYESTNARYAPD
jgi:hypothetical protein